MPLDGGKMKDPKPEVLPDVEQTDEEWRETLANEGWPPSNAFFADDGEDRYDEESFP